MARSYNHGNPNADINDVIRETEEEEERTSKTAIEQQKNPVRGARKVCPQCGAKLRLQLLIVDDHAS